MDIVPELIDAGVYVAINQVEAGKFSLSEKDFVEGFVFFLANSLSGFIAPLVPNLPNGKVAEIVSKAIPIEIVLMVYRWMMGGFGSFKMVLVDLLKVSLALGLGDVLENWMNGMAISAQ